MSLASLRSNVVWTAIGNAAYLGSQYAILIVIAKLGSATLVGEFALSLAIAAPIFVLSQMQLRQVLVTDARRDAPFGAFFWTRAMASVVAFALCVSLVWAMHYDLRFLAMSALLAGAKVAESQGDIAQGAMQRNERMDLVALSLTLRGLVGLSAVALTMGTGGSLLMACGTLAASWWLVLVVVDLPLVKSRAIEESLTWNWDGPWARHLMRMSMPLTLAAGVGALCGTLPRYFLERYEGADAVALFSAAMAPIALMGLFTGALSQATLPRAAVYLQSGQSRAFRSIALKLAGLNVLIGAAIVGGMVLFGELFITIFFTPEFLGAVPIMIILGAGVALSGFAAYGMTVLAAGRHFTMQLVIAVAALLVQVAGCIVLIPRLGLDGAAWADFGRLTTAGLLGQFVGWQTFRGMRGNEGRTHAPADEAPGHSFGPGR